MPGVVMPTPSKLLQYLPAVYQQDPFIGQFLLAFEKILLGSDDGVPFPSITADYPTKGLEQSIADLAAFFKPLSTSPGGPQAPDEFLPWLAGWTALTLRADLPVATQRQFLANSIQFYRRRGTLQNLTALLALLAEFASVTITEPTDPDAQPHVFNVALSLQRTTPAIIDRQIAIVRSVIDLEKPAHTDYELTLLFPSMQVGVHSRVGVDTQLGAAI